MLHSTAYFFISFEKNGAASERFCCENSLK